MSQQLQITGGAKVRDLQDVIIGTSGVLSSLAFNVANGVPKLDVNGKILVSQLPNSVMEYLGTWDASTNTPTLVNGTGNQGDVYLCNVAGTVNFGAGPITFAVGDSAIYSGTIWQKAGGATGTVTSVGLTSTGNDAITITGSPITTSGNINLGFAGTNLQYINGAGDLTTFPTLISSIGLSMPSAFSVANSPLTSNGTIAVTGAGYPSQYIRGDGTLADFPTSGGGGSSVSYYLNGGTSQGTIGGVTYYEMSKTADTGTMADFSLTGNGFIVAFLTDAGDPAQLNIPAGNWNYEIYASMSANGGTPEMYAELYKYDGTTFTLIATSPHEILYDGTALNLYTFAMTVPSTTLAITDRLAVKLYATNSGGKTTTVHTQDSHLCQIITTFSTGITALNGLTAQVQYFATGTSGTDFNISSTTATHTFNIPSASATNRGLITTGSQTIAGNKTFTGENYFSLVNMFDQSVNYKTGGVLVGVSGYISQGYDKTGTGAGSTLSMKIADGNSVKNISLDFVGSPVSTPYTYTFPAASGTIALTSDLSSYVPYTGATASVNIGNNLLSSASIQLNGDNTSNFGYLGFKQYAGGSSGFNGYTSIFAQGTNSINIAFSATGGSKTISFLSDLISSSTTRSYSLPDADGTIALTSSLSSYLPLAGGTLTGALNGTSAVFSSTVQASAYRLTGMTGGSGALYWTSDRVTLANYNATGVVQIEANGGTSVATFGGATYNNDFVGTLRNTTSAYFATTSGNVGIGNVSASYKLDVSGTGRFTGALRVDHSTASAYGAVIYNTSATGQGLTVRGGSTSSQDAFNVQTYDGNTSLLSVQGGGKVGIGENSPASKLSIGGVQGSTIGSNVALLVGNVGAAGSVGNLIQIGLHYNPAGATPASVIGAVLTSTSGFTKSDIFFATRDVTTDTAPTERMRISNAGVVTISALGSGAVTATSGVLSATSDMNLKISDGYIDTALDKILKLTPRYFYWKEETGLPTDLRQLGFYAQEVNEAIGEEGANTPRNENDKWGIYDRAIIAMLTKAMQEQQELIEDLKTRLDNAGL